jgi:predicted nucleic acid-binding protein
MTGFLVDTNVLVEGIKGNERKLLELVNENLGKI